MISRLLSSILLYENSLLKIIHIYYPLDIFLINYDISIYENYTKFDLIFFASRVLK